jgi:hypothetical protein
LGKFLGFRDQVLTEGIPAGQNSDVLVLLIAKSDSKYLYDLEGGGFLLG